MLDYHEKNVFQQEFTLDINLHTKYLVTYSDHEKFVLENVLSEPFRMSAIYWTLSALAMMESLSGMETKRAQILQFVRDCQNPLDGGVAFNTNHDSHLLSTLSALQICFLLDETPGNVLDVDRLVAYVSELQRADGSFVGDKWNEIDTRFSFCAIAALFLVNRLDAIDTAKAREYVIACRNCDGGFGTRVGSESHAGQVYCCLGALLLLSTASGSRIHPQDPGFSSQQLPVPLQCDPESSSHQKLGSSSHPDSQCVSQSPTESRHAPPTGLSSEQRHLLAWWLSERQLPSGGLNGRPEKLADVCYSWWVLASLHILGCAHWISAPNLISFILLSQDTDCGGIADRPGDICDPFHTLFGVAALSLLDHERFRLRPVDPVLCMPSHVLSRHNLLPTYRAQ